MYAVRNLYTSLLVLLSQSTDRELARIVRYLVEENRILRARLPERINVTRKETNRLLRFGRNLGSAKRAREPLSAGVPKVRDVHCRERLGGLLKHYYRKAA